MSKRVERTNGIDFFVTEIDVSKCKGAKSMYHEFSRAFDFPDSPNSGSLDVLLDFMQDLGWHKQKNFKVITVNIKKASKYNLESLEEVQRTLQVLSEYWKNEHKRIGNKYENKFIVEKEKSV